ncbi:MAG: M23 family metallopeptidase [Treponema sp.]|nr:M23 family metallopeptidase [Treponema sp.]
MEVFNFVDYQTNSRKKTFLSMNFIRNRITRSEGFRIKTKDHRTRAKVMKMNNIFSFHSFLVFTGCEVIKVFDFIKKHIKTLCIILGSIVFTVFTAGGIINLIKWNENYTSPLVLSSFQESEIQRLDELMANFAMENYSDVNESGDITDAVISYSTLFSQPVTYQTYIVQRGDTVSGIAKRFGLSNISSLISVNGIGNVRAIGAGQKLKIPSLDGIVYTVKAGDTLTGIAEKNKISESSILDVNDLSTEILQVGQVLFLPGAKMDQKALSLAMGDQFICPIKAKYRISSKFGQRSDPFSGKSTYHKGLDYACPTGTGIYASMGGTVKYVGESWLYGKHVIIDHGNGYQTLYAHMSKITATKNTHVTQGTRIGDVGSTGYSTGPHLHFTVYKNGNPVNPASVIK